ncbi:MAG: hypothetical protein H6981_03800 [Gammaproteobacteria bacterium]|nr:hypothetical protein [Gammaproteobacteria bacterium]MCP5135911.1 hypothetical protein [Gammaproteobacteria bacterium]
MKFNLSLVGLVYILLVASAYADSWDVTRNEHGIILQSDEKIIYLGKDCDAMSPLYGEGMWYWKDSDLVADLSDKKISFTIGEPLYSDRRCEKNPPYSSASSNYHEQADIDCSNIDIEKEKIACYVLTVGPKACSQAISENNPSFASSISQRVSLSAACTAAVKTSYAKQYVADDFLWNVTDELLETGCSTMTDDNSGFFTKLFIGVSSCITNVAIWAARLDAANACARRIEQQCGR